jgi:IclR family acetate operon transcriptional repressor
VLEKVLELQPVRVGELAARMALPKSTIQRDLRTLDDAGWLTPIPGDYPRWEVSPRVSSLFKGTTSIQDLRRASLATMDELKNELGLSIQLAVPTARHQIVIIEQAHADKATVAGAPVGAVLPKVSTSAGIAMLAPFHDGVIESAYAASLELMGRDSTAALSLKELMVVVENTRRDGYATLPHPQMQEVFLSAAISDQRDQIAAALSVGFSEAESRRGRARGGGSALVAAAARIGMQLAGAQGA